MNPPSEDIKDILAAASALALTFATDLFVSEMPATPDLCVTIYDTGGFDPDVNFVYDRPTVQIRVRGDRGEYLVAHGLAQTIRDLLSGEHNYTINGARYIAIWAQGDIISVGYDDNHRPILTINFRLHRTNA